MHLQVSNEPSLRNGMKRRFQSQKGDNTTLSTGRKRWSHENPRKLSIWWYWYMYYNGSQYKDIFLLHEIFNDKYWWVLCCCDMGLCLCLIFVFFSFFACVVVIWVWVIGCWVCVFIIWVWDCRCWVGLGRTSCSVLMKINNDK